MCGVRATHKFLSITYFTRKRRVPRVVALYPLERTQLGRGRRAAAVQGIGHVAGGFKQTYNLLFKVCCC